MQRTEPKETHLHDYKPSSFLIDSVDLVFNLDDKQTQVDSHLKVRTNPEAKVVANDLILQGQDLNLKSIKLNNRELTPEEFEVIDETLVIKNVPAKFSLDITTEINPEKNLELSGLYKSNGNFCTQCESEGFRRITYFLDRPDIMARYTTAIIADAKRYPVLLSNGNLVEQKELPNNKRYIKWKDPFKKPSYLFALVAGDFALAEDHYKTNSGRMVKLQIFAEKRYSDRCKYAMDSLKKAMKWDEENFGRECDLDYYKLVGISDFNAGAMENKGLNIFNIKNLLASPETTTDFYFVEVDATIGHEYFHNWTGNRVTCRDWFQLCLKEGLTMFREFAYLEDSSSVTARIDTVTMLRNRQFVEDSGPTSHAVQPKSYVTIDNFYTSTVYRKGAEIYRMLQIMLGKEIFRKGMDLYFNQHDGQAVTIDHFVQVMEDVSGKDLSQFKLWFHQAGTPIVEVQDEYDAKAQTYKLKIKQTCKPTPDGLEKKPLVIPMVVGLIDENGDTIPLMQGEEKTAVNEKVLLITKNEEEFCFANVVSNPTPSLFRKLSAPVHVVYDYKEEKLLFLSQHDPDLFNRHDAVKKYMMIFLLQMIKDFQQQKPLCVSKEFLQMFDSLLKSNFNDCEVFARMITLPTETELANQMEVIDIEAIQSVLNFVNKIIAEEFYENLRDIYFGYGIDTPEYTRQNAGIRSVKNAVLKYLVDFNHRHIAFAQFEQSLKVNMTNTIGALYALIDINSDERDSALELFCQQWKHDNQAMDFWFQVQASSRLPDTFENVQALLTHPSFDIRNPNKLFAVMSPFCANLSVFHDRNGEGYKFLKDMVLRVDSFNASAAAELVKPLTRWKQYDERRQHLMKSQLISIYYRKGISKNVHEVVKKSLAGCDLKPIAQTSPSLKPLVWGIGGAVLALSAYNFFTFKTRKAATELLMANGLKPR